MHRKCLTGCHACCRSAADAVVYTGLKDALEVKVKDFLAPLFVAIAGSSASFSVVDSMEMLGPDMSRARIRHAIEVLGGVSKKAAKRLEKEYQNLSEG